MTAWRKARWGGWIADDPVPMTNDRTLRIRIVRLSTGKLGYQVRGLEPIHTDGFLNPSFVTLRQARQCVEDAIRSATAKLATTGRANRGLGKY